MKKFKRKYKNEKGSVTLFVLIAMLFFILIVYVVYQSTRDDLLAQNREVKKIQQDYEKSSNEIEMEKEYENLVSENLNDVDN